MPRLPNIVVLGLAVSLILGACSPSDSSDDTTTSSTVATTTSEPTTTSGEPPSTTTTSEAPIAVVAVEGDLDADLAEAVAEGLTTIQDPRFTGAAPLPEGLVTHMALAAGLLEPSYAASATTAALEGGDRVGVVRLDTDDVLLVADEGEGWMVVGADMPSLAVPPWFGGSPRRVLVLGSDARRGGDPPIHRMDSIHILTAVPEQRTGTILGYPRDSWVTTDYGSMRVNALTSSGRGPDVLFDFFTDEWGVPLEGWILTGFAGFEDLVAATLGRLRITIPISIPTQEWFDGFPKGEQTLTPLRVLDFARTRKLIPGGDFTRSYHQGIVMLAVLTRLQEGTVDDVPMLLQDLVRFTETNLTASDLVQLGAAAMDMDIGSITNEVLPGTIGRAGGGQSVVLLDPGFEDIVTDVVDDGIRDSEG
jgi:anionic cell wall polymer biosynthesis LytR-Cps2A-Psr (LCP) family protein